MTNLTETDKEDMERIIVGRGSYHELEFRVTTPGSVLRYVCIVYGCIVCGCMCGCVCKCVHIFVCVYVLCVLIKSLSRGGNSQNNYIQY